MADNIAQWLAGHGLGQYARAFAENDIDFRTLPMRRSKTFDREQDCAALRDAAPNI
jgi:hypothetical protein